MATLATGKSPRVKKWSARVKVDWTEYYLGVFMTKEEAEAAEQQFRDNARRSD